MQLQPLYSVFTKLDLPRRDKRQRLAAEGAEYATGYLKSSPCYYQPAVFSTPEMDLETFILQLLSPLGSLALLSSHAGTLALMGRIVESGICPKASSSPHHLFLAAWLAVQHATVHARTGNERWMIALAQHLLPLDQTLAVVREVDAAVEARGGLLEWALHDEDIKIPTQALETSSEVIDFGGTRNALREIVTTKYTTGKTTTAVSSSRVYRLKAVRGKLVCDRSDVFSPPPSHVTYFLS